MRFLNNGAQSESHSATTCLTAVTHTSRRLRGPPLALCSVMSFWFCVHYVTRWSFTQMDNTCETRCCPSGGLTHFYIRISFSFSIHRSGFSCGFVEVYIHTHTQEEHTLHQMMNVSVYNHHQLQSKSSLCVWRVTENSIYNSPEAPPLQTRLWWRTFIQTLSETQRTDQLIIKYIKFNM